MCVQYKLALRIDDDGVPVVWFRIIEWRPSPCNTLVGVERGGEVGGEGSHAHFFPSNFG